jgi:hypothetical protein
MGLEVVSVPIECDASRASAGEQFRQANTHNADDTINSVRRTRTGLLIWLLDS